MSVVLCGLPPRASEQKGLNGEQSIITCSLTKQPSAARVLLQVLSDGGKGSPIVVALASAAPVLNVNFAAVRARFGPAQTPIGAP